METQRFYMMVTKDMCNMEGHQMTEGMNIAKSYKSSWDSNTSPKRYDPGAFFFSPVSDIAFWLETPNCSNGYFDHICEVTIPSDAQVMVQVDDKVSIKGSLYGLYFPNSINFCKANKVILGPKRKVDSDVIAELASMGMVHDVNNYGLDSSPYRNIIQSLIRCNKIRTSYGTVRIYKQSSYSI